MGNSCAFFRATLPSFTILFTLFATILVHVSYPRLLLEICFLKSSLAPAIRFDIRRYFNLFAVLRVVVVRHSTLQGHHVANYFHLEFVHHRLLKTTVCWNKTVAYHTL